MSSIIHSVHCKYCLFPATKPLASANTITIHCCGFLVCQQAPSEDEKTSGKEMRMRSQANEASARN